MTEPVADSTGKGNAASEDAAAGVSPFGLGEVGAQGALGESGTAGPVGEPASFTGGVDRGRRLHVVPGGVGLAWNHRVLLP
jgi:hypothetical protein